MTTPSEEMRGMIHRAQASGRFVVNVDIQTLRRWADLYDLAIEGLFNEGVHAPTCVQFTGPYDLGELEPVCDCGLAQY